MTICEDKIKVIYFPAKQHMKNKNICWDVKKQMQNTF
jgi:hypothetical protein